MSKINIRGVYFDDVNMDGAIQICKDLFTSGTGPKIINTPGAEVVQMCIEQPELFEIFNAADLVVPDGAGIILAAKILKRPFSGGRVPGIELGEHLAEVAAELGWKLFLLGSKSGVAELAGQKLIEKYPTLNICGTNDGFFKDDDEVIKKINDCGTELLFVATGVPREEKWMRANIDKLNVKLMIGLGGSFDVYSGNLKRAPALFRKMGLEWLHRLIKEPSRFKRMMKLPKFILGTIFSKKHK